MPVDTSVSLLLRLRRGADAAAWERFVELYTPLMYRWATRLGAQHADASDLVQDLVLHLIHVFPRFEYDADRSFRAWLRTVLANRWRDVCRRKTPQVLADSAWDRLGEPADESVEDEHADRAQLCREALELIRPEFAPATWSAFAETVVHGKSVADVAAHLNMSPNAIYLARGRVLRRLRLELEGLWE